MFLSTAFLFFLVALSYGRRHQPDRELSEDDILYWRRSNGDKCSPFTRFYVECNVCVCGAEGVPYCSRMDCPKEAESNYTDNLMDRIIYGPRATNAF